MKAETGEEYEGEVQMEFWASQRGPTVGKLTMGRVEEAETVVDAVTHVRKVLGDCVLRQGATMDERRARVKKVQAQKKAREETAAAGSSAVWGKNDSQVEMLQAEMEKLAKQAAKAMLEQMIGEMGRMKVELKAAVKEAVHEQMQVEFMEVKKTLEKIRAEVTVLNEVDMEKEEEEEEEEEEDDDEDEELEEGEVGSMEEVQGDGGEDTWEVGEEEAGWGRKRTGAHRRRERAEDSGVWEKG